ncbi:hypothetical protein [Nostoc sp.]
MTNNIVGKTTGETNTNLKNDCDRWIAQNAINRKQTTLIPKFRRHF